MLWSQKITGLKREDDFLFIKAEYGWKKFHLNEISSISLYSCEGEEISPKALPQRHIRIVFTLRSGRRKDIWVRRLTKRRYKWLLKTADIS